MAGNERKHAGAKLLIDQAILSVEHVMVNLGALTRMQEDGPLRKVNEADLEGLIVADGLLKEMRRQYGDPVE